MSILSSKSLARRLTTYQIGFSIFRPRVAPFTSPIICSNAFPRKSHATTSSNSQGASVDQEQLSHFNALASTWWSPHGPSRLLHLMNPLRHKFINSCLAVQLNHQTPAQKLHYLDIGCGGGIFAESAARLPNTACVTAIDPSTKVLSVAQEHARRDPLLHPSNPASTLNYKQATIEDLPIPANAGKSTEGYDVVSLFEVIEHVPDPWSFLATVEKQVKPGGWLVLSTIARTITSFLTTKVVAEGLLGLVPGGTHDWARYIQEEELRRWFEARGDFWELPRAMGVLYVPGLGWREVSRGEEWGNYFFGVRKRVAR